MLKFKNIQALLLVFCVAVLVSAANAAAPRLQGWPPNAAEMDEREAFSFSQGALGRTVRGAKFVDHEGNPVDLSTYVGKPLVVSFIYTSCNSICPNITESLSHSLDVANETFGADNFNIVTIGFDTSFDTPNNMRSFARRQGVGSKNWKFLSGDIVNVSQLSDDLGFLFFRSAKGFDHLAQVTVVNKEGKVYKQVYGDTFETPHLIEPLKDIMYGTEKSVFTAEGFIKKLRFYCTIYDPKADRYKFDYSYFISLFAGFTVMIIPVWVLAKTVRRGRKERKQKSI